MKPSEKKCTPDHDQFIIEYSAFAKDSKEFMEDDGEVTYEFEKPILTNSGNYIGSMDFFFVYRTTYPKNDKIVTRQSVWIAEFKPETKSISDAIRQLKVYGAYYPPSEKEGISRKIIHTLRLEFVTYEDLLTDKIKQICEASEVHWRGIKRGEQLGQRRL